jgi:hypothetical protein
MEIIKTTSVSFGSAGGQLVDQRLVVEVVETLAATPPRIRASPPRRLNRSHLTGRRRPPPSACVGTLAGGTVVDPVGGIGGPGSTQAGPGYVLSELEDFDDMLVGRQRREAAVIGVGACR